MERQKLEAEPPVKAVECTRNSALKESKMAQNVGRVQAGCRGRSLSQGLNRVLASARTERFEGPAEEESTLFRVSDPAPSSEPELLPPTHEQQAEHAWHHLVDFFKQTLQ